MSEVALNADIRGHGKSDVNDPERDTMHLIEPALLIQYASEHPGSPFANVEALRQQICRGLVLGIIGNRKR
jgi:hypothetical protein